MKTKILFAFLVLSLLFVPSSKAKSAAYRETGYTDAVKIDNVVMVQNELGSCSGGYFYIPSDHEKTLVITAGHCVPDPSHPLLITSPDGEEQAFGTVIVLDPLEDLAVIQVQLLGTKPAPLYVAKHQLDIDSEVFYAGNTLEMQNLHFRGTISKVGDDDYLASTFVWFGCSGSPIYNAEGEVVGVVSALPAGIYHGDQYPIFELMHFYALPKNLIRQIKGK